MNKKNRFNILLKLVLGFFTFFLFSCKDSKIPSGEIEYEISYPYNHVSRVMEMMLPKKMNLIFKEGKMLATIKKGHIFSTEILSDEINRTVEMRLDFGSDVLNTFLTPENIDSFISSQPVYSYEKGINGDSLVGLTTKRYTTECSADTLPSFESVFTTDLSVQDAGWFTSYHEIKGMPLNYVIDRYGIIMSVKAVKFTEREVLDKEFEPKEDFEEVSYIKYDHKVKDLFNVMME